jgi:hypothetical protein
MTELHERSSADALFAARVEGELLPALRVRSSDPGEAVICELVPPGWELVGCGHFAAVFAHPSAPDRVVKVYASGRPGIEDEVRVYELLGEHPAYSTLLHHGPGYLVLRRLHGHTMFECLRRGLPIPERALDEIDRALDDARARGLHPHDVHAKNVMITARGDGLVVDISDFLQDVPCRKWADIRRAYHWIYRPLLSWLRIPIPAALLEHVRRCYRRWRRLGRGSAGA